MSRLFPILLFITISIAKAEDHTCYHVRCHMDSSGTIWCDNQEFDCGQNKCKECRLVEQCDPDSAEGCMFECSSRTGDSALIIERPKPHVAPKPFKWGGGLGGYGADGGAFERQGSYRDEMDWDLFQHQYSD